MPLTGFLRSALLALLLLSSPRLRGAYAINDPVKGTQQQQPIILPQEVKRVAIIGAGAAGSATAYYLEEFAAQKNLKVDITVFERNHYVMEIDFFFKWLRNSAEHPVGGRSTTVNVYGDSSQPVELGASIFVKVNTILYGAVEKFGLNTSQFDTDGDGGGEALGVWDGDKFVFTMRAGSNWWDTAKMVWKYGLSPIRTDRLTKKIVGDFLKMYSPPVFPWKSLQETVHFLGLAPATSESGLQYLEKNSIYAPFSTHVIQASTRVNYAANLGHIHGLEALVCMATDDAVGVVGGNWQIFAKMIETSGAQLRLNTTVTGIERSDDGESWEVKYSTAGNNAETAAGGSDKYDAVVVAGPYQYTGIKASPDFETPEEIEYVRLHVTLFSSPLLLSPKYFHYEKEAVPDMILTTLSDNADPLTKDVGRARFWSANILRTVTRELADGRVRKEYVYKIFSPEEWTDEMIAEMMGLTSKDMEEKGDEILSWKYRHVWNSYPVEKPRSAFGSHVLGKHFYYTGNMEPFISTMETNSLSGKNVAANMVQDWTGPDDIYKEEL